MFLIIDRKKAWIFLLIFVIMGVAVTGAAYSKAKGDTDFHILLSETAKSDPAEEEWVTLPGAEDPVFLRYNALQRASGFDLSPYAGKTVLRKAYYYPAGQTDWRLNLLYDQSAVIGGDWADIRLGGCMLPLCKLQRSVP